MSGRQQFNVTLPPELVRRLKYRAIDEQLSASHFVEQLLARQLDHQEAAVPELTLQPMLHVRDVRQSVAFFEALGARVVHGIRDGDFVLLAFGGTQLSLLGHPPNPEQQEGKLELNFHTQRDLAQVESELRSAGVPIVRPATDEGFGAQVQISSPDGLLIKINSLQPELYT